MNATNHLQRQSSHSTLRDKLRYYLKSEHVDPSQYPHAYLVTSPRLLGLGYSPVSFWFLYSPDKVLSAIIVEMQNIFEERHCYFVTRNFETEAKHIQDGNLNSQELQPAQIKATVQKEFHFSPFNSRKGSYSVLASDPLGPDMRGFRELDITLSLFSSKGYPKLVAKLISENPAIDPCEMNIAQKVSFTWTWFWSVVLTLPRFVKEYISLFYRHNLHFWYRPEPRKNSTGRSSNVVERVLERVFRAYLRNLVEGLSTPVIIRYTPSGDADVSEEVMRSPLIVDSNETANEINIKILTPAFYSRFVHYAHDSEAIFCELAESCTFWTDKPEQLTRIFLKKGSSPLHASSIVDYVWFQLIKRMRRLPRKIERPLSSADKSSSPPNGIDIRNFRISSMDAFVIGQGDTRLKEAYKPAVLRVFVADRIALGSTTLLGMMELLGRVAISWTLASLVVYGFS
ncbi:cyclopropane-fatty-acyl-phospholipid synthase [Fusarium longipes]|uniref:Cyclopropane-fatty-acyl-phospholipid synthase n=1 Tax=Fusarium longipes TaxID=694270 RepID=A0A395S6Z6_9HYPO|nr:cyclopropane-fatty-acyl-phospholipid synthase [Fusarium longipes]